MTADPLDLDAIELLADSLVVSGGHPVLASNAEGVRRLVAEVRRLREGIRQHRQASGAFERGMAIADDGAEREGLWEDLEESDARLWALLDDEEPSR